MKNKILGLKNNFLARWGKNSIYLGIVKGYSVSTLPVSVEKFYNNIFIRILRFIGGIFFLLVISKMYLKLPENLHLLCTIIAAIQITQIIIILLIRFFYAMYILIYRQDKLEVRNSPLDRYASMIVKVLYCAKFGCLATGVGASLIAGGVSYDLLLAEAGHERKFLPFMGQVYKSVFGEGPGNKITSVVEKTGLTETPIKKESITEMVTKYQNMSSTQKQEFLNELNKQYEEERKSRS
jgi:hypothetical protein